MKMIAWLFVAIFGVLVCGGYGIEDHMREEDIEYLKKNFDLTPRYGSLSRSKRDLTEYEEVDENLPPLDVVTVEFKPYVYIVDYEQQKFKGYMVDLLFLISKRLRMKPRLYLSPDGRWGSEQTSKDGAKYWNGMIGEVIKKEHQLNATNDPAEAGKYGADVAAAALTITKKREEVVDFAKPFAHLGLTVMLKKPTHEDTDWPYDFNFVKPLAAEVWASVFASVIVVWLFMWMMNKFNPYEYGERYERGLSDADEASMFNVTGSFWFAFTLLNWQGYDRSPRSLANKLMGCFWMVFVTLFLVIYTGSYINNLFWASTVHGRPPTEHPVRSLADLVMHKDGYTYGTMRGGSTEKYLMEVAAGEEFDVLRRFLKSEEGQKGMVKSTAEGIDKARHERYGFIMETMSANYHKNIRPCDLMSVDHFGLRSYGMALPNNSPHLEKFHSLVLEMTENGDIDALEQRWFVEKGECWNVTQAERSQLQVSTLTLNEPKRVNMQMFWSLLVILVVGLFLSGLTFVAELLYYKYKGRYDAKERPRTSLANEEA